MSNTPDINEDVFDDDVVNVNLSNTSLKEEYFNSYKVKFNLTYSTFNFF